MSKTYKYKEEKSIRGYKNTPNKMPPYLADKDVGNPKFPVEACNTANPHGNGYAGFKLGISKTGKLIAKNANRSRKKAARQQFKKEIKIVLNDS